ncbi:MAG TPA: DUF4180 domain-containing protein [Brevundimonas sp.]|nr:DUF4180 domain-containing protein [Brevundimonas sp.]
MPKGRPERSGRPFFFLPWGEAAVMRVETWNGSSVAVCETEGPLLVTPDDINDFLSLALETNADWLALPVGRLSEDFFRLSTRLAGETAQKFVNYRVGLAIIGDIASHIAASDALADYVRESNRGRAVWFAPDLSALRRLEAGKGAR